MSDNKQTLDDAEIMRKIKEEKLKDSQMVYISSQYPMNAEGYKIIEQIGVGMLNNKVYRAKFQDHTVAIKTIDLSHQSDDFREKMRVSHDLLTKIRQKEVHSMSLVSSSPHVVQFFCSFVQGDKLWIVMEMQEGSIRDVLKWKFPKGIEDEAVIASILYQTLQGIDFLHQSEIIHRDIKAGNILFDKEGNIKLADFGVSAILQSHDEKRTTMAGTWHWMAPEVIDPSDTGGYDKKADIWSLGITAIEITFGMAPYADSPPNQVVMFIMRNPPPTLDDHHTPNLSLRKFSQHFKDFVKACLQTESKKRPPANKLVNHKFFKEVHKEKGGSDILKEALVKDLPSIGERFEASQQQRKAKIKEKEQDIRKGGKKDGKEEKKEKTEKTEKAEKTEKTEKTEKREKGDKSERSYKREKEGSEKKSEKPEKEKGEKSERKDREGSDKREKEGSEKKEKKHKHSDKETSPKKKSPEEFSDSDEILDDV